MHVLCEVAQASGIRLAENPAMRTVSVMSQLATIHQPPYVASKPSKKWVLKWDLALELFLQRKLVGAKDAPEDSDH